MMDDKRMRPVTESLQSVSFFQCFDTVDVMPGRTSNLLVACARMFSSRTSGGREPRELATRPPSQILLVLENGR